MAWLWHGAALPSRSSVTARAPAPTLTAACCIHYFTTKELILRKARDRGDILLDCYRVQLLSDLSKTLDKHRALRPLLGCLREHEILYSWCHPFQLQVRLEGSLLYVRDLADVPGSCAAMWIPTVLIQDWPYTTLLSQRPPQRRRGHSPLSPHGRPREAGAAPR